MCNIEDRVDIYIKSAAASRIKAFIIRKKIVDTNSYLKKEINYYIRVAAANIIKARIKRGISIWV